MFRRRKIVISLQKIQSLIAEIMRHIAQQPADLHRVIRSERNESA
jgi:hypothetical protein